MEPKLSKPQTELLIDLHKGNGSHVSLSYAPARKLVEYGYAEMREGKYCTKRLTITPSGIARSEALKGGGE